jgi:hypothetical protein
VSLWFTAKQGETGLRKLILVLVMSLVALHAAAQAPDAPPAGCASPVASVRVARVSLRKALAEGQAAAILASAEAYACARQARAPNVQSDT